VKSRMLIRSAFAAQVGRRFSTVAADSLCKEGIAALAQRIDLKGKVVLVRADLNVPLSKDDSPRVKDDTRIAEAVPTLQLLADAGARVVACSHLGRPKGAVQEKMRLAPVAERLAKLVKRPVVTASDCIGSEVQSKAAALSPGSILLLENLRFHKQEEKNDPDFARALIEGIGASVYVNDAFGAAHRAHASTAGVAAYAEHAVAGLLLEKELKFLYGAMAQPQRPFTAIVGGAKVSSKIGVIESLLDKVDSIIIGGGMCFTFFKARGFATGLSLVEEDQLELAARLEEMAAARGVTFLLPSDIVVADRFEGGEASAKVVAAHQVPDGWLGLDIGPASIEESKRLLASSKTVLWNGPMGVFEQPAYAKGTLAIAQAMADLTSTGCTTIVGGGDSVAAVNQMGLSARMSHISTGGGASLELIEGKVLPGVAALQVA